MRLKRLKKQVCTWIVTAVLGICTVSPPVFMQSLTVLAEEPVLFTEEDAAVSASSQRVQAAGGDSEILKAGQGAGTDQEADGISFLADGTVNIDVVKYDLV